MCVHVAVGEENWTRYYRPRSADDERIRGRNSRHRAGNAGALMSEISVRSKGYGDTMRRNVTRNNQIRVQIYRATLIYELTPSLESRDTS